MTNHITAIFFSFLATSSVAGVMPDEEKPAAAQLVVQTVREEPETFTEAINQLIEFGFMALFLLL